MTLRAAPFCKNESRGTKAETGKVEAKLGIKMRPQKKKTDGKIVSLFRAMARANVPEFTLAGQTCLSIPNRESRSGKKEERGAAAGKGWR